MSKFCSNCGKEVNENAAFCDGCGNALNNTPPQQAPQEKTVEIKGDFPIAQSKIPLQLLDGEQLILQYNVAIIAGAAANGMLSLTNKRILIKKDGFGKASLKNPGLGLLAGVVSSAVTVIPEIKLSNVASVQANKIRGQKGGVEIITKDGYTHKYIFQSMKMGSKEPINVRDSFVSLIQSAIAKEC